MNKINTKKFGKVAVLMGGLSAEREVSLSSGKAILAALLRQGVDAHAIDVKQDAITQLQHGSFDTAFNILHGRGGEDGVIQGVLDYLNLPYPGSGVTASAISMDKIHTKHILQNLNIATLPFLQITCEKDLDLAQQQFGFPLCIKPACEGSSNGSSKVTAPEQLLAAYETALKFDNKVMSEPWIEGREFTVGILDNQVLPAIEICPAEGYYDYNAKYNSHDTTYICPCDITDEEKQILQYLSLRAFDAIGCEHWGRIDFLQDKQGKIWCAEVNTLPGMTETSLLPKAAKAHGMDFDTLVLRILNGARYGRSNSK
ncbi:MAG: D-alanine--D-alanine ligase [Gammaproteobacteria bacterium]|jgi:D-alanine-D-alanine ligase